MTDRRLFLAIGGSTIVSTWVKPVVKTVTVPAHAATSFTVSTRIFRDPEATDEIVGDPPQVTQGETIYLLVSTSPVQPNITLYATKAFNGDPEGSPESYMTSSQGQIFVEVMNTGQGAPILPINEQLWWQATSSAEAFLDAPSQWQVNLALPSDIRLKNDVRYLGEHHTGARLYSFRYMSDRASQAYVGVMAQDLLDTRPDAVVTGDDGYYRVHYEKLGLRMVSLEDWQANGPSAVDRKH